MPDDRDDHHGGRRDRELGDVVHLAEPPRRPPGTALWGRGELVEHGVQDAVRERGGALLQPRPDDAGDVAFGAHRARLPRRRSRVGLEGRAQPAHRVMKSGSDRPDGDAERLGDLVERQVEVVVEDHHRAMVDGESPEAALELVAIDDRAQALRHRRLVGRQEAEVRRPAAGPASLGVAGAHEEPVRPGVEARRVAELRKVPPDGQQRLLRRVLGEVGVAQDPVRHRVESVAHGDGEAREGLLVAVLRPSDQLGIHALPPLAARSIRALTRYGRVDAAGDSIFASAAAVPADHGRVDRARTTCRMRLLSR